MKFEGKKVFLGEKWRGELFFKVFFKGINNVETIINQNEMSRIKNLV